VVGGWNRLKQWFRGSSPEPKGGQPQGDR
jgi:hypothetical protein